MIRDTVRDRDTENRLCCSGIECAVSDAAGGGSSRDLRREMIEPHQMDCRVRRRAVLGAEGDFYQGGWQFWLVRLYLAYSPRSARRFRNRRAESRVRTRDGTSRSIRRNAANESECNDARRRVVTRHRGGPPAAIVNRVIA